MKISQIKIQNFRGYREEISVDITDLTTFIGKNDAGKSTILEALDIFFNENKGTIKLDKEDINKQCAESGNTEIIISVVFDDLPDQIIIDTSNQTTLSDEYLLNRDDKLEIVKKYPNAGKEKVFIRGNHPTNSECSELLLKKQKELKEIIDRNSIEVSDKSRNAVIRKAIWSFFEKQKPSLEFKQIEIDATKEDAKNIWEGLKKDMPLYSLFQSDRKNSDGDSEIQDPMKLAVAEILKNDDLRNKLGGVAEEVSTKLGKVASNTLEKLKEMNPEIATSLKPNIPKSENLKWADVFKNVSISGDEDIPINKRGSGVKRLILLNFFRGEAERRQAEKNVPSIIYAVEEPETSQHPDHQSKLIDAFKELSQQNHTQIILTTHSPGIVKMLDFKNLKLVKKSPDTNIVNVQKNDLPYPSLNEVNFLAFDEASEEYHNELYGFIDGEKLLEDFKEGKETREYKRKRNDEIISEQKILSEYIRHQIHHPENTKNQKYTNEELQSSINTMRNFIKGRTEETSK